MINCEEMALRIERECYRQNMSIEAMLRKGGLPGHTLWNIRNGRKGPCIQTAMGICRGLGKSMDWLVFGKDTVPIADAATAIRAEAQRIYANGIGNQWAEKEAKATLRAAELVEQMGVRP